MLVTIVADASHCTETGAAGYGFWIASVRGCVPGGGPFVERCRDSTEAEIKALAVAMHRALKERLLQHGDRVLLQTDCIGALRAIQNYRPHSNAAKDAVEYILSKSRQFDLTLVFKHVKGHTNKQDARHSCNRACDNRARRGMMQARNKIFLTKLKEVM